MGFTICICFLYLNVHSDSHKTLRPSGEVKKKIVMMEQYNNVTVYTFSLAQLTYIVLIGMVFLFIDWWVSISVLTFQIDSHLK